jgi:hypothetical protein
MKKIIISTVFLFYVLIGGTCACKKEDNRSDNTNPITGNKMKIVIGTKTYNATLFANKTTDAFKAMLPLNLDMTDLNNNEKKFDLPINLPTNIEDIGNIHEGDILLWGNNTIVLFYKNFSTPYRYTKIGKIDNASGLAAALGSGDVKVGFELQKD